MAWKPIVAASDLLIVNAAYLVAYVLHSGGITAAHEQMVGYARLSPVVSLLALMSFHLSDLYRNWLRKTFTHVLYSTVIGNGTALIATATWSFWSGHLLPRSVLVIATCIQVILIAVYREMARRVYRRWFGCQHTIVIAESNEQAWDIAEKFVEHWAGWYEVVQCLARRGLKAPYTELMSADTIVISADLRRRVRIS
jgi:FlaA1/EpsC-like NDP-sugar epimerase